MLPEPLHPTIVHFPVVLAVILPLAVGWGLYAGSRRGSAVEAWVPALAVAGLLAVSAAIAEQTGEQQEEVVEGVVGEAAIEAHEEAAEPLLPTALTLLACLVVSLVPRVPRRAAVILQGLTLVGSLVVVGFVWRVGRTGGELVYRHGAASAYTTGVGVGVAPHRAALFGERERDDDDDDHDD